jgi:hypothetical protein
MEDLTSTSLEQPITSLLPPGVPTRRPSSSRSAYTSRSIVSLSGLSVSDPLPGSYETSALAERKYRSSSLTSLLGGEEDDDSDSRIPTTTFRYNPKLVLPSRPASSHFLSLSFLSSMNRLARRSMLL